MDDDDPAFMMSINDDDRFMSMIRLTGTFRQRSFLPASPLLALMLLFGTVSTVHGTEVQERSPYLLLAQTTQPVQTIQQPNVEMIRALYELTALKEEMKYLRNRLEEMNFRQQNDSRRQEDFLQDVDRRLIGLEQQGEDIAERLEALESVPVPTQALTPADGEELQEEIPVTGSAEEEVAVAPTEEADQAGTQPTDDAQTSEEIEGSGSETVEPVDTVTVSSTRTDEPGSVSLSEQDAYDSAFEALKLSRYEDAITQFQGLVTSWPDSELADDSLYWMSEARYVIREFEAALNGFRSLIERYPQSSRVPEAMLKVGYIQYDIGAYDQAASTFEEILARFPGHQVSVSAQIRLRRIKQTINSS